MAEALVVSGVFATTAAATAAIAYTQFALTVYGLYRGYRQGQKARAAADSSLSDRKVSISSSDMARSVVYGTRIIGGRPVYIVEARDEAEDAEEARLNRRPPRPANPYFYVVMALEAAHECDAIEEVYLNNQPIGPLAGDPNVFEGGSGTAVAPGSRYYKQRKSSATYSGVVDAQGQIIVPGQVITGVLTLEVSANEQPPSFGPDGELYVVKDPLPPPEYALTLGAVTLPLSYVGRGYTMTYLYEVNQPLVRVWYYRGRAPEDYPGEAVCLVNQAVQQASGGEWSSNCRGLGCPYVVVQVTPDLDVFPSGMPNITVKVRGKRTMNLDGSKVYSESPPDHLYDYLRTEWELLASEINIPLAVAARAACNQEIIAGYGVPTPGAGSSVRVPIIESRYKCHVVLSTEASRLDNARVLLSAMSGTMTWAGGQFDIRAGVAHDISNVSLDDSDLADESITVKPEPDTFNGYNSVRGRFASADQNYTITDFPPYRSAFYQAEDRREGEVRGPETWMDLDLPAVTSSYQAQRIALLQLRLSRNALSYTGHYKPVLAAVSAGEIVNITNETFGWNEKPFHLTQKQRRPDGTFDTVWTEAALPIYNPNWSEMTNPDPSPNTQLTPADVVGSVNDIVIVSGADYADYGADGAVRAYALVSWDQLPPVTAVGGRIELWYKFSGQEEWTKAPFLPGDATSYRISITRNRQIAVQIRAINGAQVAGPWNWTSHFAGDVPTEALTGNLLLNAEFAYVTQLQRPDADYDGDPYIPGWRGPFGVPATGGIGDDAAVYLYPRQVVFEETPGVSKTRYTGIVGWGADDSQDYRNQYIVSDPVSVEPGARLIAFVSAYSERGRVKVGIEFLADGFSFQSFSELTPSRSENSSGLDLAYYDVAVLFQDVPVWANRCRLIIQDERPANLPSDFTTVVNVSRPFLGYASAGQLSTPPWSK